MRPKHETKTLPEYASGPAHWGITNLREVQGKIKVPYPQNPNDFKPDLTTIINANNKRYWDEFREIAFEFDNLPRGDEL